MQEIQLVCHLWHHTRFHNFRSLMAVNIVHQQSVQRVELPTNLSILSQLLQVVSGLLKEVVGELAGASQQSLLLALALLPHGRTHIKHSPFKGCIRPATGFQEGQRDIGKPGKLVRLSAPPQSMGHMHLPVVKHLYIIQSARQIEQALPVSYSRRGPAQFRSQGTAPSWEGNCNTYLPICARNLKRKRMSPTPGALQLSCPCGSRAPSAIATCSGHSLSEPAPQWDPLPPADWGRSSHCCSRTE